MMAMSEELKGIYDLINQMDQRINRRLDHQDHMIQQLIGIVGATNSHLEEMEQEMNEMKQDMNEMKQEMNEMKQDIAVMKQDIKEIKQNQDEMSKMLSTQNVDIEFAHTKILQNERDIAQIKKVILG
uniref:hypothetical protein n=1 Tax=Tepidibacillus infernus TaxID=1806172 RepID=UPI003BA98AE1